MNGWYWKTYDPVYKKTNAKRTRKGSQVYSGHFYPDIT
ncbi:hypothetical protein C2W59_00524 [Bacillus pumilus]|nr:hypothetical protein C2W59_00524 [Bacillus pumilus]